MAKITVTCPTCAASHQADAALLGKKGRCKQCQTVFVLKAAGTARGGGRYPTEAAVPAVWQDKDVLLDLYEVRGVLGQGGMGTVYRVRHRGWDLDLAVKSPQPAMLDRAGGIDAFEDEARAWVDLGLHPHTVTCHYVRRLGGIPRVFAELIAGGSLHHWIRSRKLYEGGPAQALERVLDIAIQCAWGLHYTHEQGLVHQDVKPANVMMTPNGIAKVTDFGLARALGAPGTLPYRSPEQANREKLGRPTDVWSWAVSVLEMFAGDATWGSGTAAGEALEDYLGQGPDEGRPAMPPRVAELLRRCFRKRPADRPTMLEAAGVLADAFAEAAGCAYPRPAPRPAESLADALNNKALSLLDLGRGAEAERAWADALRASPQHFEATYNQALHQWRAAQLADDALLRRLAAAAASRPGDWTPRYWTAQVHLERGDYAAALAALDEIRGEDVYRDEVRSTRAVARERLPQACGLMRQFKGLHDTGRDITIADYQARGGRALDMSMMTPSVPAGLRRLNHAYRFWGPPGGTREVGTVALSGDGRLLLSGSQGANGTGAEPGRLYLWDLAGGRCLRAFGDYTGFIIADLSADARFALTATGSSAQANRLTFSFWDVQVGKLLERWDWQASWDWSALDLDVSCRQILLGGRTGELQLLDMKQRRSVRTFEQHPGWITSVFLGTGQHGALAGYHDGALLLWDPTTGRLRQRFPGHEGAVHAVRLSGAGDQVLSGGWDKTVRLWDVAEGRCVQTCRGHDEDVTAVAFGPRGMFLLSGSGAEAGQKDTTLRLWEAATGRCLRTFTDAYWGPLHLTADGATAVRSRGQMIQLWNVRGERDRPPAPFAVCRPRQSGDLLASALVYRRALDEARAALDAGDACRAASCLREARGQPDCARRPEALDAWARLYLQLPRTQLRNAWEIATLTGHKGSGLGGGVQSCCFRRDGRRVASGGGAFDRSIRLWDATTGACVRELAAAHEGDVRSLCWNRDGRQVLSAAGGVLKLWDVEAGKCLHQVNVVDPVQAARLTEDGLYALTADVSGSVRLWEVATGRCLVYYGTHTQAVTALDLSADNTVVVAGYYDRILSVWDVGQFRSLFMLGGTIGGSNVFMFTGGQVQRSQNPLPPNVFVGGVVGPGRGCDGQVTAVRVAADLRHVVTAGGSLLKLWDLPNRQLLRVYYGHTGHVTAADLSPDGRFILSGSTDGTMRLWELATGECVWTFTGHAGVVNAVCFGPDGQHALSASEDGTLKLWYLDWEVEERQPGDWDPTAEHILRTFLILRLPHRCVLPAGRLPTQDELMGAISRQRVRVSWTEPEFGELLHTLGRAGFGWLRPEDVRRELAKVADALGQPAPPPAVPGVPQPVAPVPPARPAAAPAAAGAAPLFCPRCTAVLPATQAGAAALTCPQCGERIPLRR